MVALPGAPCPGEAGFGPEASLLLLFPLGSGLPPENGLDPEPGWYLLGMRQGWVQSGTDLWTTNSSHVSQFLERYASHVDVLLCPHFMASETIRPDGVFDPGLWISGPVTDLPKLRLLAPLQDPLLRRRLLLAGAGLLFAGIAVSAVYTWRSDRVREARRQAAAQAARLRAKLRADQEAAALASRERLLTRPPWPSGTPARNAGFLHACVTRVNALPWGFSASRVQSADPLSGAPARPSYGAYHLESATCDRHAIVVERISSFKTPGSLGDRFNETLPWSQLGDAWFREPAPVFVPIDIDGVRDETPPDDPAASQQSQRPVTERITDVFSDSMDALRRAAHEGARGEATLLPGRLVLGRLENSQRILWSWYAFELRMRMDPSRARLEHVVSSLPALWLNSVTWDDRVWIVKGGFAGISGTEYPDYVESLLGDAAGPQR